MRYLHISSLGHVQLPFAIGVPWGFRFISTPQADTSHSTAAVGDMSFCPALLPLPGASQLSKCKSTWSAHTLQFVLMGILWLICTLC